MPPPTVQGGSAALTGPVYIGGPVSFCWFNCTGAPNPGDEFYVYNGPGNCENFSWSVWGSSGEQYPLYNVYGQDLSIYCPGSASSPYLNVGSCISGTHGCLGVYGDIYAGGNIGMGYGSSLIFNGASSTYQACWMTNAGGAGAVVLQHSTHSIPGTCTLRIPDLAPNSKLCTDATSDIITC